MHSGGQENYQPRPLNLPYLTHLEPADDEIRQLQREEARLSPPSLYSVVRYAYNFMTSRHQGRLAPWLLSSSSSWFWF